MGNRKSVLVGEHTVKLAPWRADVEGYDLWLAETESLTYMDQATVLAKLYGLVACGTPFQSTATPKLHCLILTLRFPDEPAITLTYTRPTITRLLETNRKAKLG